MKWMVAEKLPFIGKCLSVSVSMCLPDRTGPGRPEAVRLANLPVPGSRTAANVEP